MTNSTKGRLYPIYDEFTCRHHGHLIVLQSELHWMNIPSTIKRYLPHTQGIPTQPPSGLM